MDKTFEENLISMLLRVRDAGAQDDNYGAVDWTISDKEIEDARQSILAAHQAEMDRVVEEVIGRNFKKSSGMFGAGIYKRNIPRGYQTSPESRAKVINHEHTQQRARYKAMKKRDA